MYGLAVFSGGTFAGELSPLENVFHLIISNRFDSTILNIPSPFADSEYISLSITSAKSKNKVKIINGSPLISCDVKIDARVLSSTSNSNHLNDKNFWYIEDYANSYFKAELEDYLYKTSVLLHSDIDKFGKYAVKSFSTWNEWEDYNWLNNYSNSFFDVNVNTSIKSSYLILEDTD